MGDNVLEIRDLTVQFQGKRQWLSAVDGLNLTVGEDEILGLVGESGSGKTQAMLAVMGLTQPPGRVGGGSVRFMGEDLMKKTPREMCAIRGKRVSMIFQDPMAALDPVYTCGHQLLETLRRHESLPRGEARARAMSLLDSLGLGNPRKIMASYPFELSGGMCQRVMIAMALICAPRLLIADEPTTALDVTVQAQILDLLLKIREERHMSMVLITHDLAVVSEVTDRVAILYAGRLMEEAPVRRLIGGAAHPYTQGLMRSVVRPGMDAREALHIIPGTVPDMADIPRGCAFFTRCPLAEPRCRDERPPLRTVSDGHVFYCHRQRAGGGDQA